MRVLELADRLRSYGLYVVEVAGWRDRGYEFPTRPDGAVRHWTAGPPIGHIPSFGVIVHGRSDLPGPLANTYQSRIVDPATGLDVVYVVASGKANHAGAGSWNGISGNYRLLGLEIEWSGSAGEPFGPRRKLTSELVMRAQLDCCSGDNPGDACEHREYAPGRKIDTNLSGAELRRRMTELQEEDDMFTESDRLRLVALLNIVAPMDGIDWGDLDRDLDELQSELLGPDRLGMFRDNLNNADRLERLEGKVDQLIAAVTPPLEPPPAA